jgi:hypothetical protein
MYGRKLGRLIKGCLGLIEQPEHGCVRIEERLPELDTAIE